MRMGERIKDNFKVAWSLGFDLFCVTQTLFLILTIGTRKIESQAVNSKPTSQTHNFNPYSISGPTFVASGILFREQFFVLFFSFFSIH